MREIRPVLEQCLDMCQISIPHTNQGPVTEIIENYELVIEPRHVVSINVAFVKCRLRQVCAASV